MPVTVYAYFIFLIYHYLPPTPPPPQLRSCWSNCKKICWECFLYCYQLAIYVQYDGTLINSFHIQQYLSRSLSPFLCNKYIHSTLSSFPVYYTCTMYIQCTIFLPFMHALSHLSCALQFSFMHALFLLPLYYIQYYFLSRPLPSHSCLKKGLEDSSTWIVNIKNRYFNANNV